MRSFLKDLLDLILFVFLLIFGITVYLYAMVGVDKIFDCLLK